jgi:hypothetical protein
MTAIGMSLNRDGFWVGDKMPEIHYKEKTSV